MSSCQPWQDKLYTISCPVCLWLVKQVTATESRINSQVFITREYTAYL